jgi:4-amino-4-deoxy-L-arabinose transferase-like glycosyltransferase
VSRGFRLTLLWLVAAAAAVRLWRLNYFSYGLDEVLQSYWIHGSWGFFWHSLRLDAFHPPLDYLLDKLFQTLAPSDAVARLPSVLWGCATVATLGMLLARRAGERAGLTAAALLALAPFHVRFSQELRPYSLSLLFLCLALYALDKFLERPGALRLALLFLTSVGAAYALYTAAFVLAIAAAALLIEDAVSAPLERRRAARRFLAWSPAFVLALWLAYLPWWAIFLEAAGRPAMASRAPLTLHRADRILSFLALAPDDGYPLGPGGLFFLALAAAGAWLAISTRGLRFLVAWAVGGLAAIEALGQLHPHYDVSRRFLPAGPAVTALAALALAALLGRPVARLSGALLLAALLVLDARSLRVYFQQGRADWRTLADYLRRESPVSERVFTENQYSQLCVAFYLVGPSWLYEATRGGQPSRSVVNLDGEIARLISAWQPGQRAWLVLAGEPVHEGLRSWARGFPAFPFPLAEKSLLHRLDPALREKSLGLAR